MHTSTALFTWYYLLSKSCLVPYQIIKSLPGAIIVCVSFYYYIQDNAFALVYIYVSEKAMAPHSSTLAWRIPWTEEPGGLQYVGLRGSDTTERLPFHFSLSCIGERNGNPLQCSCLENPRDGGAWRAAVSGVAESDTTEAT